MIDLHAHYLPPTLLTWAEEGHLPARLRRDGRILEFPSGPSRPVPPPLMDLPDRTRWMAEREIDLQVLSPWMDVAGDDLPGSDARRWCTAMNDATALDLDGRSRFRALAALPVTDGDLAAAELRRCVERLGFVGGAIPTQIDGRDLDEVGLEPLWEAAESLGVLIFIHPHRVMGGDRMKVHFLGNVCGNPFETTLAAMRLYFSGVVTRWPGLRILLAHGGGTLPYLAGRAVHASRHAPGFDWAVEHPDSILQCFYYDTLLHDPRALAFMIESVGPDRIAAGTDAPFPMSLDSPLPFIERACRQAGLGSDSRLRILRGTAEELLSG
ncbi:MAG: amidohydrolase family protein [bacterium]|nr:amidohydrolase family protein [bacterium]MDE0287481.1 amidohydrolase family protein [bacterium]